MRRLFTLLLACHIILGLLSLSVGIAWIILHFTREDFYDERLPDYAYLVMCPEIVCGFLIFLSGCFGLCIGKKKTSCVGIVFATCNVFNLLVWTPILIVGYSFLVIVMRGSLAYCGLEPCVPSDWNTFDMEYLLANGMEWVFVFPGIGLIVGFLDFMISIGALTTYCLLPQQKQHIQNLWDPAEKQSISIAS